MADGNFAKLNDVAPQGVKNEDQQKETSPIREERTLLAYIRCLTCKQQCAIQTCASDKTQRCNDSVVNEKYGENNTHTHIMCECGEKLFSGIVSFRTTRDTDEFNRKPKMSYAEKKRQFQK